MLDPAVLEAVGIDGTEWSGFAFGFGIDRCAQMRHELGDMRALIENDTQLLGTALVKISLNWLREFVELGESIEELSEILSDLGLVVEGVEYVGEGLDDVVVARVDEIRAIKGADRIRLVVVDAGNGPLEIVCGAMNFDVGDHVPLAPVGAVLPGGFEITERTMRGVTSHGMLCSSRELRLSDDHQGLMVLDDLVEPKVGERLLDALAITPDVIFDISVEGNRPDAWSSRRGRARPRGAPRASPSRAGARHARTPPRRVTPSPTRGIEDPDLCGRLTVSVLRKVRVLPSPPWVAQRLRSCRECVRSPTSSMRPTSSCWNSVNPPTPTTRPRSPGTRCGHGERAGAKHWPPWTAWRAQLATAGTRTR